MTTIKLAIHSYEGEERMFAEFPFDRKIHEILKALPGRRWSQERKQWHFEPGHDTMEVLKKVFEGKAILVDSMNPESGYKESFIPAVIPWTAGLAPIKKDSDPVHLNPIHEKAVDAYVSLLRLKNYSENTLKNYVSWFRVFLKYFPERKPSSITKIEIMDFLINYREHEKWSSTIQNQLINSIKFFYEKLLGQPREMYDLPRAKKPYLLPSVFSEKEIFAIINAITNIKHKSMISVAYAGGLRVSEVVNLKLLDIDSSRMVITLRQAKGKKDRQVMLSEKLLEILEEYYILFKPKTWVFEGHDGSQYSARSVQEVFKKAKENAGVLKKGSIHALRHSFATHLLESGIDILSIKELLGHASLRTTMNYTHVSKKHLDKIKSPFDRLPEN